ncbi:hypothetical protein MC885_004577 [Smutsia gigantea]|nr:hypothetical protein MC885_004577 [Smutsia gigantea]
MQLKWCKWTDKVYLPTDRSRLQAAHKYITNKLKAWKIPFLSCGSGFYIWINLKKDLDPRPLEEELLLHRGLLNNKLMLSRETFFHGPQPDIYLPSNLCNFNCLKFRKLRSGSRGRRPHVPGRGGEAGRPPRARVGSRRPAPSSRRSRPRAPSACRFSRAGRPLAGDGAGGGRGRPGATACAPSNAQATPGGDLSPGGRDGRASSPGAATGPTAVRPRALPHGGKATARPPRAPPARPDVTPPSEGIQGTYYLSGASLHTGSGQ